MKNDTSGSKISIIIPAHNEEKNLEPLVQGLYDSRAKYSIEVILVDDGSTDNTLGIIKSIAAVENRLRENFIKLYQNDIVSELSPTSVHFYLKSVKEKATENYSRNHRCEQRQGYRLCFPQ